MKPLKGKVRVTGRPSSKEKVFELCEEIVKALDEDTWNGRKSIILK